MKKKKIMTQDDIPFYYRPLFAFVLSCFAFALSVVTIILRLCGVLE